MNQKEASAVVPLTGDEKFLAARYPQFSRKAWQMMRAKRTGPPYYRRGIGRRARVYYVIAEVDAWVLSAQRVEPTI